MAVMLTSLSGISNFGDKRTWALPNHTLATAEVLVQQKKTLQNNVVSDRVTFAKAVDDANSERLSQKVKVDVITQFHTGTVSTDIDTVIAYVRDVVASDEWANGIKNGAFIKNADGS